MIMFFISFILLVGFSISIISIATKIEDKLHLKPGIRGVVGRNIAGVASLLIIVTWVIFVGLAGTVFMM